MSALSDYPPLTVAFAGAPGMDDAGAPAIDDNVGAIPPGGGGARRVRARRMMMMAGAGVVAAALAAALAWTPPGARALWSGLERAGIVLRAVTVSGQTYTRTSDLNRAIGVDAGVLLPAVALEAVRGRVEALPTVVSASVRMVIPGRLHVAIREDVPAALMRSTHGKVALVGRSGATLARVGLEAHGHLPLVEGVGAAGAAGALADALTGAPEIARRLRVAQRIGARRWTMVLDNGVHVLLPGEGMAESLRLVATLERAHRLLGRDIDQIDVRVPGRVVVRLADGARVRETSFSPSAIRLQSAVEETGAPGFDPGASTLSFFHARGARPRGRGRMVFRSPIPTQGAVQ